MKIFGQHSRLDGILVSQLPIAGGAGRFGNSDVSETGDGSGVGDGAPTGDGASYFHFPGYGDGGLDFAVDMCMEGNGSGTPWAMEGDSLLQLGPEPIENLVPVSSGRSLFEPR